MEKKDTYYQTFIYLSRVMRSYFCLNIFNSGAKFLNEMFVLVYDLFFLFYNFWMSSVKK